MKFINFINWDIWKSGMETVIDISKEETCGLTGQMRRADISIPANIVEGSNRYHNKEYRQLLCIAPGSCREVETQIEATFYFNIKNVNEPDKTALIRLLDTHRE